MGFVLSKIVGKVKALLVDSSGNPLIKHDNTDLIAHKGAAAVPVALKNTGGWTPDPIEIRPGGDGGEASIPSVDGDGQVRTRGLALTDEGSFRSDFSEALDTAITGTVSFTNGSDIVTGVGTAFLTELTMDSHVRLSTDGVEFYARVRHLVSDTEIHLEWAYEGSTGSGTGMMSRWLQVPADGSVSGVEGAANLVANTTSGGYYAIYREVDYPPLKALAKATVSQRIAGQSIRLGAADAASATPKTLCRFVFDGTDATKVKCVTAFDATVSSKTTLVTIPGGKTSLDENTYEIDLHSDRATFLINKVVVAEHRDTLPDPYCDLAFGAAIHNEAAVASQTTLSLKEVFLHSYNELHMYPVGPLARCVVRGNGTLRVESMPYTYNVSKGEVPGHEAWHSHTRALFATSGYYRVTEGSWAEQATGARRSFKSASASDTAAGTGARKILLSYINTAGYAAQEVITLNGHTAVNTVATDIKWVNGIRMIDSGTSEGPAGNISMYSAINGGGSVMAMLPRGRQKSHLGTRYAAIDERLFISRIETYSDAEIWFDVLATRDHTALGGGSSVIEIITHMFISKSASGSAADLPLPIIVDPGQKLELWATTASINTIVAAALSGWTEKI